ncbi:hypothetical protein T484DRAFT_1883828 [Baffinella frigidus]|nr:hypothetical protein T484DRAFT_1883828 [Cryptophyta sp. CCMP2293]
MSRQVGALARGRVQRYWVRKEYKLVTIKTDAGKAGVIKIIDSNHDVSEKPFNARWDGGKTTILITLEDPQEKKKVLVYTPRGETLLKSVDIEWTTKLRSEIEIKSEKHRGSFDLSRIKTIHRLRSGKGGEERSSPRKTRAMSAEKAGSSLANLKQIDFAETLRRSKGGKVWRPWATFERSDDSDFATERIRLLDKRGRDTCTLRDTRSGSIGPASCRNYIIDLEVPVLMHTIPRHFSFTLSPPGTSAFASTPTLSQSQQLLSQSQQLGPGPLETVSIFAHTERLPTETDYMWKGEAIGHDLTIAVKPTDPYYKPGQYFVSVITTRDAATFELLVEVNPFAVGLRGGISFTKDSATAAKGESSLSNSKILRRGRRPPPAIEELTQANSETGKMLHSLMIVTDQRRRKSSFGATLPPKPQFRMPIQRPATATVMREERPQRPPRPSTAGGRGWERPLFPALEDAE